VNPSIEETVSKDCAPMKSGKYEPGMKINFDPVSGRVVVSFRGRISVLPEKCGSEAEGKALGESFCQRQGWDPTEAYSMRTKVRRPW
jgi:hypothetical protein